MRERERGDQRDPAAEKRKRAEHCSSSSSRPRPLWRLNLSINSTGHRLLLGPPATSESPTAAPLPTAPLPDPLRPSAQICSSTSGTALHPQPRSHRAASVTSPAPPHTVTRDPTARRSDLSLSSSPPQHLASCSLGGRSPPYPTPAPCLRRPASPNACSARVQLRSPISLFSPCSTPRHLTTPAPMCLHLHHTCTSCRTRCLCRDRDQQQRFCLLLHEAHRHLQHLRALVSLSSSHRRPPQPTNTPHDLLLSLLRHHHLLPSLFCCRCGYCWTSPDLRRPSLFRTATHHRTTSCSSPFLRSTVS